MNLSDPQAKNSLVTRLKRIEGQVRGVQTMVTDERDCSEILQQLTAIQSAVRSTSLAFIEEYASRCLLAPSGGEQASREELLKNLLTLVGKAPS
jgi:CsoR family transcriptional regulator, copper-sensing transcriptional repressor